MLVGKRKAGAVLAVTNYSLHSVAPVGDPEGSWNVLSVPRAQVMVAFYGPKSPQLHVVRVEKSMREADWLAVHS